MATSLRSVCVYFRYNKGGYLTLFGTRVKKWYVIHTSLTDTDINNRIFMIVYIGIYCY